MEKKKKNATITVNDDDEVPQVLQLGNHQKIEQWLWANKLINTYKRRPDLWRELLCGKDEMNVIKIYLKQTHVHVSQKSQKKLKKVKT